MNSTAMHQFQPLVTGGPCVVCGVGEADSIHGWHKVPIEAKEAP